jgi:hypothetical protein
MEAGQGHVTVRAAVHALDAALAEHRRGLALAASRREQARMARAREVKAAAAASEAALEQPVERPMRAVRLAETWIEVDRVRHPLTGDVRAAVEAGELRVRGPGWSARVVVAPGDAAAAAAREAAMWIERAAATATSRARERLELVITTGASHAAACHAAAAALDAADRELLERHSDHARVESCVAELVERLGPRKISEDSEITAARDRVQHARAHLATRPSQPFAWARELAPTVAGAALRDLPEDVLQAARPALGWLPATPRELLALAAHGAGDTVVAIASDHAIVASTAGADRHSVSDAAVNGDRLLVGGHDVASLAGENRPGRLAAVLELAQQS